MNVGGGGGNCLGCLDVYALIGEERAYKDLTVFLQDIYQSFWKSQSTG